MSHFNRQDDYHHHQHHHQNAFRREQRLAKANRTEPRNQPTKTSVQAINQSITQPNQPTQATYPSGVKSVCCAKPSSSLIQDKRSNQVITPNEARRSNSRDVEEGVVLRGGQGPQELLPPHPSSSLPSTPTPAPAPACRHHLGR